MIAQELESHLKSKKIYLLLTRFPDNGSKAIGLLTGGYYVHASIGLEADLNTFYSFVAKGFIVEKIARYIKPDRPSFPCQLYELEVSEVVYCRLKEILACFIEFAGLLHYTKFGLALSLLRIPYKRDRFGFFCTQFVADVLQYSGAVKLKHKSIHYFAEDLKRLPGMRLNYQGSLRTMIDHFGLNPSFA